MSKLKLILATLVVGGLAAALWLQHSVNEGLRRDNAALKQALAELKPVQEISDSGSTGASLTQEQLDELLKLRSEVTQLREQTNQIGELADVNKKLLVSLKLKETQNSQPIVSKKRNPEDALPQDIHPKETWAYRGYGTPEATIESLCWAMAKGDKAAFLAGLSPEMLAKIQPSDFDTELASRDMGEFRILDRQTLSDDAVVVTVYATRKDDQGNYIGNPENTVFKRIDGQWKVADGGAK